MRTAALRLKAGLWPALLLFLTSCSTVSTGPTGTSVAQKVDILFKGQYETTEAYEKTKPRSVAILPFLNESGKEEAPEVVRRCFYNHFSSLPYTDSELHIVDSRLRAKGVVDPTAVGKMSPQQVGAILGTDAVIYGTITHYDRIYAVLVSDVQVGAKLRMMDSRTGELLWSGEHVAHTPTAGFATTPVGLILTAISTAYNLRTINLYRTSDDLFRDMVKAIPRPSLAEVETPPTIRILAQDGAFTTKKAGDVLKVAMEGDEGLRASFDVGEFKKGLRMKEVSPGSYVGEYRIRPGDNVKDALLVGYLTSESGITAEWIDALGYVNIDTTPPDPPTRITESSRDGSVLLSWAPNKEEDLAGYRIYRSETPLTGYDSHLQTETTETADKGLQNYKPYYYKVSALDKAGNESPAAPTGRGIRGMGVPAGPTAAGGTLSDNVTWYSAAGPYVISSPVVVPDEMTLTIEPGTMVLSKGPGLLIRGGLTAKGTAGKVIAFVGDSSAAWDGIVFENREPAGLEYCTVKNARVGAVVRSPSVTMKNVEFTSNQVALRVEGAHSQPAVEGGKFHNNSGDAVEIVSGAEPVLSENQISNNLGKGVASYAASPKLTRNVIVSNKQGGLFFHDSDPLVVENEIHDNGPFDLMNREGGQTISAANNYWGPIKVEELPNRIQGRVDFNPVLDAPYPEGKPLALNILDGKLPREINQDAFLIKSRSPYTVAGEVSIVDGAVLFVEPGVTLKYRTRNSVITVKDGGIHARGLPDDPILFVSGSSSPGPGDYTSAVRFVESKKKGMGFTEKITEKVKDFLGKREESFFAYCVFAHADTPLDVFYGRPDITYSFIGFNKQSGIICRNDSRPNIVNSTFLKNSGTAAIECFGMCNPRIKNNNFLDNPFAIQSFSTITLDIRSNWWGSDPPNPNLFLGNLEVDPYLKEPEPNAFSYTFQ